MGTVLNNTLSLRHGNYLKFIPSVDQLAKTLYLIVTQLIAKAQFERALDQKRMTAPWNLRTREKQT